MLVAAACDGDPGAAGAPGPQGLAGPQGGVDPSVDPSLSAKNKLVVALGARPR